VAEERTEQATPRKRDEARRRGEVPRSAELAGVAALLGALAALRIGAAAAVSSAAGLIRWDLGQSTTCGLALESATQALTAGLAYGLRMAAPAALGACAAAGAASLAQTGFLVSARPLAFQWRRLSLGEGLGRMCSLRGAFAAGRSLVRVAAVGLVGWHYLRGRWGLLLLLGEGTPVSAGIGIAELVWGLVLRVAGVLLIVALADYLFQRRQHERGLRMSRRELRDEHKETEGDPLIRSRIREVQRALSHHRMLHAVKRATVVITNPTQIAVALRYDLPAALSDAHGRARGRTAPVVVAKGRQLLAERIRAAAERHGVPVTQHADVARAIYRSVPVGRQIPPELYQAVAEILAFVYRLTGRQP